MKNIWQENKYIDLWSLNHFLAGASFAGVAWFFKVPFIVAVCICIILFILWEYIEYYTKVGEPKTNQISDVVVATIGFFISYFIQTPIILSVVITLFLILETWGYLHKFIEKQGESPKYMPIICIIVAGVYVFLYAWFII